MPVRTALPGEINAGMVDRFTLVHGAVGVLMGVLGTPAWVAVSSGLGWEIVERVLKEAIPQVFPHSTQDTAPNAIMDAAAVMGGWWVGRQLRGK